MTRPLPAAEWGSTRDHVTLWAALVGTAVIAGLIVAFLWTTVASSALEWDTERRRALCISGEQPDARLC